MVFFLFCFVLDFRSFRSGENKISIPYKLLGLWCVVILFEWTKTLDIYLLGLARFCTFCRNFCIIILLKNRIYFFLANVEAFISCFLLISCARSFGRFSAMLVQLHSSIFPDLKGKMFNFSSLSLVFAVQFHRCLLLGGESFLPFSFVDFL